MITVSDAELLEREQELDALRALLAGARERRGGIALIEGPPGSGKTALLRAVRAEARGLPVLCDPEPSELAALALAAAQPLAVMVDDLQRCDAGRVKALIALARRIEHLPVALIVALRPTRDARFDELFAVPDAVCLRPEPLSREAIAGIVQGRLWRLGPAAVALARAVAALGDHATLELAPSLAGLDEAVAQRAHASLAAVGLLEPGAWRFTHPMMREVTLAGLIPATRSCFHRRAALVLSEAGADDDVVAAQVLAADPGNDPRAARLLQSTGERALAAGDAAVALHHLRRALHECGANPPADLLLALGLAEARMGQAGALLWLSRAAETGCAVVAAQARQARVQMLADAA